jgi:hypothetical protein
MNSYVFDVLIADNTVNDLDFVAQFVGVKRQSALSHLLCIVMKVAKTLPCFEITDNLS